ncbi:DUF4190 domain-containing protein [Catenulispora acidiphila]|nr:DUF4190 domain-containing protein [Catenulispora acidiphila]
MTTPPPPEPPEPSEPSESPEPDRSPEEPVQPPSPPPAAPIEPDASAVHLGRDAEPEPGPDPGRPAPDQQFPQYPAPPPLPPEAYPTYGGGQGYDYGGFGAPPVRRRNGMGVAALVLGIAGFLVGPTSILAIIFGRIGLNRVARGEATNRGVAQAGFVLGIVTLVLWILGLILVAARH